MKKPILILFFACSAWQSSFATQVPCATFKGTTWGPSDTAVANANFTIDTSVTIGALWFPSGQTYTLTNIGTNTIILSNTGIAWKDSSSGAKTYPSSIVFNGASAQMLISSGAGNVSGSNCNIAYNGITSCQLTDHKSITLKSLTLGTKAILTNNGSVATTFSSTTTNCTLGDSSTFTVNRAISFLNSGNGTNFHLIGNGVTVNGSAVITWYLNGSVTVNFPKYTYTGSANTDILSQSGSSPTLNVTGNIDCNGGLRLYNNNASTSYTIKFNTASFSCATFQYGGNNATGSMNIAFGSGTHRISTFNIFNTGSTTDSLQSANFICSGNFSFGSNHTVIPGTSKISTTGTCSFTSAGKAVYDLTDSLGALTFADSATIINDFSILSGNSSATTWSGYGIYVGGDFVHDGTGTINMGNSMNLPNASSLFHIGSTTGAVTATNCNLYSSGASFNADIDKYVRFKNAVFTNKSDHILGGSFDSLRLNKISLSDSVGIKVQATKKLVLDSIGDIDGSAGKLCRVQSTSAGSAFTLTMPSDTVSYVYFKDVTATNPIYAIDGTSIDGGGNTNIEFPFIDTIPIIDSIVPANGIATDQIVIHGTTFSTTPDAYLNDSLLVYLFRNDTSYTFALPDRGLYGTVAIKIKNNTYNTYDTVDFFIFYPPILSSVTPNYGKTIGGDTISIRGDTLGAVDTVWFLNDFAIPFSVTDSLVKVVSPGHAAGSVLIAVHDTNGYNDTLLNAFDYDNLYGWSVSHPASLDTAGGDTIYFRSTYGQFPATFIFDGSPELLTTNTDTLSTYITPAHAKGSVPWVFDASGTVKTGSVRYGATAQRRRSFGWNWSGFRF